MKYFINSRWYLFLGGVSLLWLLIISVAQFSLAEQHHILRNSEVQHDAGCAYISIIRERPSMWPVTEFVGDSPSDPQVSKLTLLENGKAIGRPHGLHDVIRSKGLGDYSNWGQLLIFSATDCSNPQNNGRLYEIIVQPTLSEWTFVSVLIAIMALVFSFGLYISENSKLLYVRFYINKLVSALWMPSHVSHGDFFGAAILFVLLLSSVGFIAWNWMGGRSVGLAVGGSFQISDSMMYWLCSNSLLDYGNFGHPLITGEWCQRRATYPSFLSGIAWIAQRNIFATLLVQALIVSAAIYVVVRKSADYVGVTGATLCACLLIRYATHDLFMLTMTENAGLIFGCAGLSFLLVAAERQSKTWMAGGVALFSIALNARAGAFFVLPFLLLWAGTAAHFYRQRIRYWVVTGFVAILAGFILQSLLVLAVGGSPGSSHGNFSYVLYGLSVGGKGWQQVLIDHPELSGSDVLMSKSIYAFAWHNFTIQPELFLRGLQKNISLFLLGGTYGFEKLGAWSLLIKLCWWLAWIPLFINRRNPGYLLIAFSSLGVIFSAPLLLNDGGARIFAATVVVDVLQVALGLSWLGVVLVQGINKGLKLVPNLGGAEKSLGSSAHRVNLEAAFAIFILLLVVIPFTPLRQLQTSERLNATQCSHGQYAVVTRIGSGGTLLLDILEENHNPNVLQGQIKSEDFIKGIPSSAWYREDAVLFHGRTLLLAYQQDRSDPYAPGPYPVYSDQHLSEFDGRTVRLCIDRHEKTRIFGMEYRKLNSITVLD